MKRLNKTLLATMLFLSISTCAYCEYLPAGGDECGGVNDMLLLYSGDYDGQTWTPENLKYYVFHLNRAGEPDDWFFDGFLFLAQSMPGGQGAEENIYAKPTDKSSWNWFTDRIFERGKFIDAIDELIESDGGELPAVPHRKVAIMIPYPSPRQHDFGDVDGDSVSEDFKNPEDRIKVVKWYIDSTIERWKKSEYSNIELAGFYWMEESYHLEDERLLPATRDYLHDRGMRLFWIPYYMADAALVVNSRDLGFDCTAKQPNYFFKRWQAEKSRVATTAKKAKKTHAGVEIEVDESIFTDPDVQYPKYIRYLNTGVKEGFMREAYLGYYQSVGTIMNFYLSDNDKFRDLYDLTYSFVKGEYQIQPEKWK